MMIVNQDVQIGAYMLAKSSDDISTFFRPSCILQQPIHDSLLDLTAACTLSFCYFNKRLINPLDRKWLWLSKSEALSFLGFKRNIACITNFIIKSFEGPAIQTTHIFQGF